MVEADGLVTGREHPAPSADELGEAVDVDASGSTSSAYPPARETTPPPRTLLSFDA